VRIVAYCLAAALAVLGLLFLIAAGQGNAAVRVVIGLVLLGGAIAVVALSRLRPVQQTHVHETKLHLSGDVSLENIVCKQCGANLSEKSVRLTAGAVFVKCEYCGAEYQLEEAPKW
jgi:hypothetical protein